MDPSAVLLRYSPAKWADASESSAANSPAKITTQEERDVTPTPSKPPAAQPYERKRHVTPLSSTSFEKPVEKSISDLAKYRQLAESGQIPIQKLETHWYYDVINVGQRLKVLRDTFKVIQSARKKKAMGERADFRSLDAKPAGVPLLSDDENPSALRTDDDDEFQPALAPPPPNRRGRPRKKRGKDRAAPPGRTGNPVGRPPKRTRAIRAAREQSSPVPTRSPTATPEAPASHDTRRMFENAQPELEGPPLPHSPPILPSQSHSQVAGVDIVAPPPNEVRSRTETSVPEAITVPQPAPSADSETNFFMSSHYDMGQPIVESAPAPFRLPSVHALMNDQPESRQNTDDEPDAKRQKLSLHNLLG